MTQPLITFIESIDDGKSARLRLTLKNGEPAQLDCTFKKTIPPHFSLLFPPKSLAEEIEVNQTYSIEIASENSPILFMASVESFEDNNSVILKATELTGPDSLRELPRVTLSTTILATPSPDSVAEGSSWEISGSTIDLSETGVLCIFPIELEENSTIQVRIELPSIDKHVECAARVVRTRKVRKERYQTALRFDNMTKENSEALMAACVQEQRNLLRQEQMPK